MNDNLVEDINTLIIILHSCLYVLTGEYYENISSDIVSTLDITEEQKQRLDEIFIEIYETQSLLESSTKLFWEK